MLAASALMQASASNGSLARQVGPGSNDGCLGETALFQVLQLSKSSQSQMILDEMVCALYSMQTGII